MSNVLGTGGLRFENRTRCHNKQKLLIFLSTKIRCNDLTQLADVETDKYTLWNMCNNSNYVLISSTEKISHESPYQGKLTSRRAKKVQKSMY